MLLQPMMVRSFSCGGNYKPKNQPGFQQSSQVVKSLQQFKNGKEKIAGFTGHL
jgi:hypothetical protein